MLILQKLRKRILRDEDGCCRNFNGISGVYGEENGGKEKETLKKPINSNEKEKLFSFPLKKNYDTCRFETDA